MSGSVRIVGDQNADAQSRHECKERHGYDAWASLLSATANVDLRRRKAAVLASYSWERALGCFGHVTDAACFAFASGKARQCFRSKHRQYNIA